MNVIRGGEATFFKCDVTSAAEVNETFDAIATQLGPVPVVLHRYADSGYRVYPRASFADYLVRWVLDAAEEFCHEEVL